MQKNYYQILGLSKESSLSDIKKKYKELALINHPDKGGDPEKFKEIAEAYEILSNEDKRRHYDNFGNIDNIGMNPFNFGAEFGFDIGNIFNNKKHVKKCETKAVELGITLEDIYNNKCIIKNVELNKICVECSGNGFKQGCSKNNCSTCNGRGIKIIIKQHGNMIQQIQMQCDICSGEGFIINDNDKCVKCNGLKVCLVNKKFEINLNTSINNKQQLIYNNIGNEYPNYDKGDVIFIIEEKKTQIF